MGSAASFFTKNFVTSTAIRIQIRICVRVSRPRARISRLKCRLTVSVRTRVGYTRT